MKKNRENLKVLGKTKKVFFVVFIIMTLFFLVFAQSGAAKTKILKGGSKLIISEEYKWAMIGFKDWKGVYHWVSIDFDEAMAMCEEGGYKFPNGSYGC